jgi:hypothetical protein
MGYCCYIKALFGMPSELLQMIPISSDQKVLIMEQTRMLVEQINLGLSKFDAFQIVVISVMAVLVLQFSFKITMWLKENLNFENLKTYGFRLAAKLIP